MAAVGAKKPVTASLNDHFFEIVAVHTVRTAQSFGFAKLSPLNHSQPPIFKFPGRDVRMMEAFRTKLGGSFESPSQKPA